MTLRDTGFIFTMALLFGLGAGGLLYAMWSTRSSSETPSFVAFSLLRVGLAAVPLAAASVAGLLGASWWIVAVTCAFGMAAVMKIARSWRVARDRHAAHFDRRRRLS